MFSRGFVQFLTKRNSRNLVYRLSQNKVNNISTCNSLNVRNVFRYDDEFTSRNSDPNESRAKFTPKRKVLDATSETSEKPLLTRAKNDPDSYESGGIPDEKSYPSVRRKKFTPNRKVFNPNNETSEKDFLVKAKHDPDSFGDESVDILDEGDIAEEKYHTEKPLPSQKMSIKQYADHIKDLIRKRKLKEAIDYVEIKMVKEDRVKPGNYIYNLLIGACGRVGYTKKAFSLYNDMKKRAYKVTPGTYTALFNACANSPWKDDCLTRANHLRDIMIEKMYEPNIMNYNAMIKAFGRSGDLNTAFALVDEMISKGIAIKHDTINFLLQACISDKDAGFRHALLVWHKLKARRIQPSVFTYNLMLRCIRDCGIGDISVTKDVIEKLVGGNADLLMKIESPDGNTKHIHQDTREVFQKMSADDPTCITDSQNNENRVAGTIEVSSDFDISRLERLDAKAKVIPKDNAAEFQETSFNCDNNESHVSNIERENSKESSVQRLSLLGPNILDAEVTTKPNNERIELLETTLESQIQETNVVQAEQCEDFTHVADNIAPNLMADVPHLGSVISLTEVTKPEDRLLLVGGIKGFLESMKKHNCEPDIKTFTQLLDNIPSSLVLEEQILKVMKKYKVKPDLDFYNMLIKKRSFRCDYEGAKEVLDLIYSSRFQPNLITYGVLALCCRTKEEGLELIQEMQSKRYRLNMEILGAMLKQATYHMNFPYVLELMELTIRENITPSKRFMEILNEYKKKTKYISNDKRNKLYHSKKFMKEYNEFRIRYKSYVQEVQVEDPEDVHPWQQFRQENENDKFKNKAVHFKPVHNSRFKVKTTTKHKKEYKK